MIAHQNAVIKEAVYMEGVEKYQDRQRKERERKFLPETALATAIIEAKSKEIRVEVQRQLGRSNVDQELEEQTPQVNQFHQGVDRQEAAGQPPAGVPGHTPQVEPLGEEKVPLALLADLTLKNEAVKTKEQVRVVNDDNLLDEDTGGLLDMVAHRKDVIDKSNEVHDPNKHVGNRDQVKRIANTLICGKHSVNLINSVYGRV